MNMNRWIRLAAASLVTAAQWALCLGLLLYTQPSTTFARPVAEQMGSGAMPVIVVTAHRP